MSRCLGANPPYGCGHFQEHQEAARKGWATRRRNARFKNPEEHTAFSAAVGYEVSHLHHHPEHTGKIRFKADGKWYEVTQAEYRHLLSEGRAQLRLEEQFARRQAREDARREASHQRDLARKKTLEEREEAQRQRQAERDRIAEERVRAAQERQLAASRHAQYNEVVKFIREQGGIRPNRAHDGKIPELEEWRDLPRAVKTRRATASPLDDMGSLVSQHFLGLNIENGDDLAHFLQSHHRRMVNARLRGKPAA